MEIDFEQQMGQFIVSIIGMLVLVNEHWNQW